jgi:RimJ/RimL family protein N-acetyltransferase
MGLEQGGVIISAALFNCFEGSDLHISLAGDYWPRSFLREIGRYVFEQLGCRRMTGVTASPHVVRLAERAGAAVEGLLRHHFDDGSDGFVVGFLREEYKFGW